MKKLIIALALLSTSAYADGFKCQTITEDLNIKVFNQVQPELGTRNPAVMVLSNPAVNVGRKAIAVLRAPKTLTTDAGMKYVGRVDLRFKESRRKGELILGTKLGYVKTIELDLDFSYGSPVALDDTVLGTITINKRNGDQIFEEVTCSRYLKN